MQQLIDQPLLSKIKPVALEQLAGDRIAPGHRHFGVVGINPERVVGMPFFFGTRVPIKMLFDSLAAGESLDQRIGFLTGKPQLR